MRAQALDNSVNRTQQKVSRNSLVNSANADDDGLAWSGRPFGGIIADISRRAPWYLSDWTDGAKGGVKTFTAALYMFFACLAPGIAFGAFFDQHSGGKSGVVEYLITQSVGGVIFALFSGQPLVILRPTGPITVFISQLYTITDPMGIPYLTAQAWVGIFVGTYMLIIAATDACAAIRHCSRFTQDLFGFFVSVIFIYLGCGNIVDKFVNKHEEFSAPHQLLLTIGTLYTAVTLAAFGKNRFFNGAIRETIADFAVPLAVLGGTVLANLMTDVELEPLPVPSKFGPTDTGRDWMVDLCPEDSCGKAIAVGAVAAIPLVMLFFVDQNVTMLLTQHPDHHLKKGAAFHYNFFILGCFNIIFPIFGCPYITGSLPHSPQFVRALARTRTVRENGRERTEIVEVIENRVSPLLVNVLILVALPKIEELSLIPTAVICDALFLFMGLSGLPGNELFERLKLVFTEESLYPVLPFSKESVPRKQMHLYTFLQFSVFAVLFGVSRSPISLAFPVFLVLSIPFRMNIQRITCGFITTDMVLFLDHKKKDAQDAGTAFDASMSEKSTDKDSTVETEATSADRVRETTV